jgi:hypothetical protein
MAGDMVNISFFPVFYSSGNGNPFHLMQNGSQQEMDSAHPVEEDRL